MPRPLRVFLCHSSNDKLTVRELYSRLNAEGWIDPWLDEVKLYPGQDWNFEIEKAVENADVILVSLTKKSVNKEGYVQRELRIVLDIAAYKPEGTLFVIPIRLEECDLPPRLRSWQYADYFPENRRDAAYQRLLFSLRMRAAQLDIPTEKPIKEKEPGIHVEVPRDLPERMADKTSTYSRLKLLIGGVLLIGMVAIINLLPWINGIASPRLTETPASNLLVSANTPLSLPTFPPNPGIGSTIVSEKDGMTMVFVPAGKFMMGSELGENDEKPAHFVSLSAFWIDQTEVTNAMYAKCVDVNHCEPPKNLKSNTRPNYFGNSEFYNYPVIYVDWDMANKYCEWAGRRLPTEAEWEKSARGAPERIYPWGNTEPNDAILNFRNGVGDTTEVGSYPAGASLYGALDLAGNVQEWVGDWYSAGYYASSPLSNPMGPDSGVYRVVRGGSWVVNDTGIRSYDRQANGPIYFTNNLGVRCAISHP